MAGSHFSAARVARRATAVLVAMLAFAASTATAQETLDAIRTRGTLIWGADEEGGGPFVYPRPDDPTQIQGFEVELADYFAGRLGVRARFAQGQWDKLPELLNRGDVDIVMNGYEWTPPRAARFGLTLPYYLYELQLLARRGSGVTTWDDLRTLNDGERWRIAVLGGSAAQDYLVANFPETVEAVSFDGVTDAMRSAELETDRIVATLQDLPIVIYYEEGFSGLQRIGDPVGRGYYVILTRVEDRALREALNQAIIDGSRDGTFRKIYQKYRLWNGTQARRALEVDAEGRFAGEGGSGSAADGDAGGPTEEYVAERGWSVLRSRGWLLVKAACVTVLLSVTAMPLAVLIGLILALSKMFGPRPVRLLGTAYIEIVRGTPLVLQLYVIFFLLPEIGISIEAFWAGVIGLAINYSAYEAEIYRAGLQAIPHGQMEASIALGMSRSLALRRIIIPQATRIVVPPMTNDFIALFKDTAVCSVITVVELSKEYYIHARSTGAIIELGLLTAVLYLAMSYPLSLLAGRLERRLRGTSRPA